MLIKYNILSKMSSISNLKIYIQSNLNKNLLQKYHLILLVNTALKT